MGVEAESWFASVRAMEVEVKGLLEEVQGKRLESPIRSGASLKCDIEKTVEPSCMLRGLARAFCVCGPVCTPLVV